MLMERLHGAGLSEFDLLTLTDDTTRQGALRFCDAQGRVITGDTATVPRLIPDQGGFGAARGQPAFALCVEAQVREGGYLSQFFTLHPGDVASTGTPPGVGLGMKPPQYLKPGEVVELGIEGLGRQRQLCIADE